MSGDKQADPKNSKCYNLIAGKRVSLLVGFLLYNCIHTTLRNNNLLDMGLSRWRWWSGMADCRSDQQQHVHPVPGRDILDWVW